MSNVEQFIIEECRFCGNKTKLDIVASYVDIDEVDYYDEELGENVEQWLSNTEWKLLKCCVCGSISIGTEYEDYQMGSSGVSRQNVVFPDKTYSHYHMPKEIYSAYEVALKAKYLDGALCLLSLRRTLEIICKEQGELQGNLVTKVTNLANKGVLPTVLKEASDILRKLGNAAAHGDNTQFGITEVNQMIEFTELIIEYIYILPEKISKLK